MALQESEAIILRTHSLREADLLVTFFTRAEGKVHGVARSAKKGARSLRTRALLFAQISTVG